MKSRPLPGIPPANETNSLADNQYEANENFQDHEMYFVMYDFDAGNNENQLSVKKGELIRFINVDDKKIWCEGENKLGVIGWLPYAYIVPYSSV